MFGAAGRSLRSLQELLRPWTSSAARRRHPANGPLASTSTPQPRPHSLTRDRTLLREMTTIPSRLAQAARTSASPEEAAARARTLYRTWYRGAPEIIDMYQIPCSVYDLRTKVREQFEKNKHVTDVRVIDILILKGRQEFQESINYWKTPSHIMGWFNEQEDNTPQPTTFMDKFLAGRDDPEAVSNRHH